MRFASFSDFLTAVAVGIFALTSPLRSSAQEEAQPRIIATSAETSELPESPDRQNLVAASSSVSGGDVSGTVTDSYGDVVPGATVLIKGSNSANGQSQAANDNGFFEFKNVTPGIPYQITVNANGFDPWVSPPVIVASGQYFDVTGIKLRLQNAVSSVTVVASTEQIATEQVTIAEQQRILGFIPNFYVVYNSKDAVPLTTKLKFQMAYKVSIDPVSILGAAALAGMNQAGDRPDYQQGWKGYGQRFGAAYADGLTDILFGGAILPSLLHQDPRYFYQGTGTVKSRTLHALANPFICKGDNGRQQVNYSSMGGDLISSAISNAYYPDSNRGAGLVFNSFLISTATREVSSVVQEFVLRKLTPSANR
jgi:Carboxypeptidase regulatory-like domain